jgi:hypothetical protein
VDQFKEEKLMQLKAVVSVVVSLVFALTMPTLGMSQIENGAVARCCFDSGKHG